MAEQIEWLKDLPQELQEKILEFISKTNSSPIVSPLHPIEIDGIVYEVPLPVIDLVNSLWAQIKQKD